MTGRPKESAEALTEALQIVRELAKANPATYLPAVLVTLNNLGVLYKAEGQNTNVAQVCNEAAAILKQLSVDNSSNITVAGDAWGDRRLISVCSVQ
jgi:hypothetical protein